MDGQSLVVRVAERKEDRFKRMQQYHPVQSRHYMQAAPVPSPAQPVPPSMEYKQYYGVQPPRNYTQALPVPSPAQPVPPPSMSSPYGYLQPFHIGAYYYPMATQLPQMSGHQNMTTYVSIYLQLQNKHKPSLLHYDHSLFPFI